MIRLPNLDDQSYDDIMETTRRRVMQYFPEWSNFNPSDPGVTILELFAWLKEMQQYHLNRITNSGILSCLRLLGLSPEKAAPARVTAMLRKKGDYSLAEGFPYVTDDGLVFETILPVSSDGVSVSAIWTDTGDGLAQLSGSVYNQGLVLEPFGASESEGSCLYIGFTGPTLPELKLYFEIYDDYPVARSPFGEDIEPSRDVEWAYGPEFDTVIDVVDMTRGFSVSGEVRIGTDSKWAASQPAPEMQELFWLRARLESSGAEESPKIRRFFKDFSGLIQRETFSCVKALWLEHSALTLTDYLGVNGEHIVFSAGQGGWKIVPDVTVERAQDFARISTGGADGSIFRVVSVKPGFNALMSTETNLPGIRLDILTDGFFEELSLMIEDGGIWYDWVYIEELHTAGPYDKVFTIDMESGSVIFGDNVNGACPPAGRDNILLSVCRVTKGAQGNILPHTLDGQGQGEGVPIPDNISSAVGGRDPETLGQCISRVSQLLSPGGRLVTAGDYEKAAAKTPGTRILKVRALEGYDTKTGGTNIPARVSVVIQPYSAREKPLPDARMIKRVSRHLERGRLLGSRVEVAAPEYIPVSVRVDVIAAENSGAEGDIIKRLNRFLSPTEGSGGIGEPVRLPDVTAEVSKCPGVVRVVSVMLSAPENAASIDRAGNVILPGHAIAYAGNLTVNISSAW